MRGTPAQRLEQIANIALDGLDGVRDLAASLRRRNAQETARAIQLYVQALPFVDDPPGPDDFVRAPCAVAKLGGDCDCLAVLIVALDELCALEWRLSWLLQPGARQDHVAVEVAVGPRWWWQEATVAAALGEHPYRAAARAPRGQGGRVWAGR